MPIQKIMKKQVNT